MVLTSCRPLMKQMSLVQLHISTSWLRAIGSCFMLSVFFNACIIGAWSVKTDRWRPSTSVIKCLMPCCILYSSLLNHQPLAIEAKYLSNTWRWAKMCINIKSTEICLANMHNTYLLPNFIPRRSNIDFINILLI